MSRDNALWGMAGVLVGFVAAYFLFEAVAGRQPPRVTTGTAIPAAQAPGAPTAAPGGAPDGVEAPFLQQRARQLEGVVENDPTAADAWLELANLRFDLARYPAAVEAYERHLELATPDPDVLTDFGLSLHMIGRPEDALAQFDRAQQIAPDHWKSQFNEAFVLAFDLGRFDEAWQVVERLRRMQPGNPDVERLATEISARRSAA
ncbi:MAG TPA: tetratricopeptide repeat protein [Thermoanaerobaculia bacterium]|nr:tetratricopeptide repeat protein [Thermoanaerobaculia bacterium]